MYTYAEHNTDIFKNTGSKINFHKPGLKNLYQRNLIIGLTISMILHFLVAGGYYTSLNILKSEAGSNKEISQRVVTMLDLNTPPPQEKPPIEIKELAVALKDLSALTPEPVAKKYVKEEVILKNQQELEKVTLPVASTGTDDPSKVNPDAVFTGKVEEKKVEKKVEKKEEKVKKSNFYEFEVEKAPVAVNLSQIKNMMRYPEIARQSGIEGRVIVKILVNTDGSVIRVGGISGPEIFHQEVSEKIMNLQFTPALQSGKPVRCWVSVPFSFKLGN